MILGELVRTIDGIETMPIYRQLFDFLCLASIAISVAEASGSTVQTPIGRVLE